MDPDSCSARKECTCTACLISSTRPVVENYIESNSIPDYASFHDVLDQSVELEDEARCQNGYIWTCDKAISSEARELTGIPSDQKSAYFSSRREAMRAEHSRLENSPVITIIS